MGDSNRIYGIDLGTTYSCIAYVDEHGKPVVVSNSEGQPTTPSVVYFEGESNIAVGITAKDVAEIHPDRVVSTVKRVMGDPNWVFEHQGDTYHPQDISSFILRKLVNDAQVVTGDTITDVVITCPAYFGVMQKEATKQAGVLAGLNVRYVIPEPTAAAIAYGIEQSEEQVILVFDLGGGTFDITLIEVKPDALTVVCTGGDYGLGGRNWDEAIALWFAEQFSNEHGVPSENLTSDPETWQELLNAAESAKMALSSRASYTHRVRYEADRAVVELRRDKFDELTAHLLERTLSLTDELLATARAKGYAKVDRLLLVGGSTYMPQVIESVQARFPFEVRQFDPNQAVAKGAALFGFKCFLDDQIRIVIAGETGGEASDVDIEQVAAEVRAKAEQAVAQQHGLGLPGLRNLTQKKIRNVSSKSFGIVVMDSEVNDERVNNLIVVDEAVPRSIARQFGTYEDNQEGVMLRCMENTERVGPSDRPITLDTSTEVGTAELQFTCALPKGSPIEITFSLGEDGLLTVHGKDLTTDQAIETNFMTTAILTKEEVQEKKSRNLAIAVS
ncbi:MAG: Hsp70 family protein [Limisphaerales bacterium]